MLRFILFTLKKRSASNLFQYISCYVLSLCINKIKNCFHHFNTSHVTVYRLPNPCYNWLRPISIHLMLRFIARFFCPHSLALNNFNTSHVTVYPMCQVFMMEHSKISIHLMLRFINNIKQWVKIKCGFQYISCYGLS